jgi:hypothetical protein
MDEQGSGGDWLADYLEWKMQQLEAEPWTPPVGEAQDG